MTGRKWSNRILSRRRFLLLVGGGTAALTVAACGQSPQEAPAAAPDSADGAAGEPQRGGTLRVAFPASVTMLDPTRAFLLEEYSVAWAILAGC